MIHIRAIFEHEIPVIQKLARKIWTQWYLDVIMDENQLNYMLDLMYNEEKIKSDLQSGVKYLVIENNQIIKGYAAYQNQTGETKNITKLHKLYVLTDEHKMGYGGKLFDYVETRAKEANSTKLFLHVNRENPSIDFYKRKGMEIVKSEDNDIGNGYFMYDYVMEKTLISTATD